MASDKDQEDNGEFTYQLNDPEGAFSIDPRTGWLTVRNQVNFDDLLLEFITRLYLLEKVSHKRSCYMLCQLLSSYKSLLREIDKYSDDDDSKYLFSDSSRQRSPLLASNESLRP